MLESAMHVHANRTCCCHIVSISQLQHLFKRWQVCERPHAHSSASKSKDMD